ncbi:MAG: hypothetical protein JSS44_10645 [Proteobacteria bacterium]|nr:hypothetical protein [Pseudomonadota bacterium]
MVADLRSWINSRAAIGALCLVYCLFITYYFRVIGLHFQNVVGYGYHSSELILILTSFAFNLIPVFILPLRSQRVSISILWIVYFLFFVPAEIVPQYLVDTDPVDVLWWNALLLGGFCATVCGHYVPVINISFPKASLGTWVVGVCTIWVTLMVALVSTFGTELNFASLDDVYRVRGSFKDSLASSGPLIGYLVVWGGDWLAPLMLVVGLVMNKKKERLGTVLITLALFLSLYIYGIAAYKSVAFSLLACVAFMYVVAGRVIVPTKFFFVLMGIAILAFVLATFFDSDFVWHQLLRRLIISPGMDAAYYFEYFHRSSTPSGTSAPETICMYAYGNQCSANAGYLAAAYATAGSTGVVMFGAIAGIALWLVNSLTRGIPLPVLSGCFLMVAYALSNSALGTVFGTYGMLLMTVSIALVPLGVFDARPDSGIERGRV